MFFACFAKNNSTGRKNLHQQVGMVVMFLQLCILYLRFDLQVICWNQIALKIHICRLNKYKTQKWEIQFEIFVNIVNSLLAVEAITQLPLTSQTMKKHLSGFVYGTLLGVEEYSITCSNIRFGLLSHLKIVDLFKTILHQGKRALF